MRWSRRGMLRRLGGVLGGGMVRLAGVSGAMAETRERMPVVDAHLHLFDPGRPGGVPWPEPKDGVLYQRASPERYAKLAQPLGVVAAVAVEASPLPSDNAWLLREARRLPLMVGVIGDLDLADPGFASSLAALRKDELFLGVRYGNLWGRDPGAHLAEPTFRANLRELAASGLVLESANPGPKLVSDLLRMMESVPGLRLVVDHLPQAVPPAEATARASYLADLRSLAAHRDVCVKGSEILRRVDGVVSADVGAYREWLDFIWGTFGEDRVIFGSDWPNSDTLAPVGEVFAVARAYVGTRSPAAQEAYFWRNATRVYRWRARTAEQQTLLESVRRGAAGI